MISRFLGEDEHDLAQTTLPVEAMLCNITSLTLRSTLLASHYQLNSGHMMPQLQLGLYMMSGREVLSSIPHALEMGYRGFDSAQMYHNETEAGKAISSWLSKSGSEKQDGSSSGSPARPLTREDVFYTSKLASNSDDYDAVRRSIAKSVKACGLGYIDLFLLHSPYGGPKARRESWRAVEDAIRDGEVRSGGVSNYGVRHVSVLSLFAILFP